MTVLHGYVPQAAVPLERAMNALSGPTDAPFSETIVAFCAEFARRLGRQAKGMPELQALAFWMRRSELVRLEREFREMERGRTQLVPAGSVLHFPPANVDTIFIYSWMLSLLCGNSNVTRLSSRGSDQTRLLTSIVADLCNEPAFRAIADRNLMVGYGHDSAITTELSSHCDVRVIWGGDASVDRIRSFPLAPSARDITFPDRASFAAIGVGRVLELADDEVEDLATRFYNDSYWFDQLGCSSPRLVAWVGDSNRAPQAASRFFAALDKVIVKKGESARTGTAIDKMTYSFGAAVDLDLSRVDRRSNELTVVQLQIPSDISGAFCGGGFFYEVVVESLADVAPMVTRRYQTLSHAGIATEALHSFVRQLNGSGIDRVVPIGQALTFNRYWDGKDLLQEFTRRVYLEH